MTEPIAPADPHWRGIFAVAGAGALLSAVLIPIQIAVYIAAPPPATHALSAWLDLFTTNPILGLVSLDVLMMVEQVLLVPIALAIWLRAHRAGESAALLGVTLWLAGAFLLVAANPAFDLLALARAHTAAPEPERASYLGAAQAMLTSWLEMGSAFTFGYVVSAVGGVVAGAAMVRARMFGRAPGLLLATSSLIGLGIFIPGPGIALAIGSVIVVWGWYARLGWGFLRLARAPISSAAL